MKYTFSSTFFESMIPVSFVKLFQRNSDNELLETEFKKARMQGLTGRSREHSFCLVT